MINKGKVAIIGSGFVGSTTAYTLMMDGVVSEIVVVDLDKSKAEGDVLDMNHGMSFVSPVKISAGQYSDIKGSDIVIITAGVGQKDGETRTDLLKRNIKVFDSIIESMMPYLEEHALVLVVTNPVDILTYYTIKKSGLPAHRVLGSGTVLDTSRLKFLLSEHTGVDSRNVHTYVLGEHGDTEVAAFSLTTIAGMGVDEFCNTCGKCVDKTNLKKIALEVKNAAYEIIEKKGATYYAVALAVDRIVDSILRNENSILTVSSLVEDKYGIDDVCLSLPTIVNKKGIEKQLLVPLSKDEEEALRKSAESLRKQIREVL